MKSNHRTRVRIEFARTRVNRSRLNSISFTCSHHWCTCAMNVIGAFSLSKVQADREYTLTIGCRNDAISVGRTYLNLLHVLQLAIQIEPLPFLL